MGYAVANNRRSGFTLVELVVTLAIISILASLSLAALAGARQRGKIDKTKSTIRKLHEIIQPQYESYINRRVRVPAGITDRITLAQARLTAVRALIVQEMPDQWADVYGLADVPSISPRPTAPAQRYAAYKHALSLAPTTQWSTNSNKYQGAECLAMIVTRGGFSPDASEGFRNDEMGDIDADGAPEFWDGWGRPVGFIRWAAGFSSIMQPRDTSLNPDPLDPFGTSSRFEYPTGVTQTDYGLTPLIYSSGPNGALDDPLSTKSGYRVDVTFHWLTNMPILTTRAGNPVAGEIDSADPSVAADNITNHDLTSQR